MTSNAVLNEVTTRAYSHQKLGEEYNGLAGYYSPRREVRVEIGGRELFYVVGWAVIESSCCGTGSWEYVLVPGYLIDWKNGISDTGLPTSTVEPVDDCEARSKITELIRTREHTTCITFW
jgi:hypothetical protein